MEISRGSLPKIEREKVDLQRFKEKSGRFLGI